MNENEMQDIGEQIVKKKRGRGNPALTGDAITATPGENAKYIELALRIFNLPTIDLHDPDQVRDRLSEYFRIVNEYGSKPTVAGLGNALNGMDRQTLWEIRTGNYRRGKMPYDLPAESSDQIKKAYKMMEQLWEEYMQNGRINPVSGIFLGKNNYGYQDKQDIVITPNRPEEDYNANDIANRYTLPAADDEQ